MSTGKRILGVDYGDVRTGIAVSDPGGFLACGIGLITERNAERLADKIAASAAQYDVGAVVLGFPVNMDGSRSNRADRTELLRDLLRSRLTVPVELLDERCTTLLSHRILSDSGKNTRNHKQSVDTLSAEIILQDYLDKHRND